MELTDIFKIKKAEARHLLPATVQTGFTSPATHYLEPKIDLNKELVSNRDATFFLRISGDAYAHLNMYHNDVLIVDRSLKLNNNNYGVITQEGEFKIAQIANDSGEDSFELWGIITYVIHSVR